MNWGKCLRRDGLAGAQRRMGRCIYTLERGALKVFDFGDFASGYLGFTVLLLKILRPEIFIHNSIAVIDTLFFRESKGSFEFGWLCMKLFLFSFHDPEFVRRGGVGGQA